jgi:hypothetical protein
MSFQLDRFEQEGLSQDYLGYLVEQEAIEACQHYARFWDYFRNTITPALGRACDSLTANSRPYFQAQEQGLPARITGVDRWGGGRAADLARKEVVVENDIAWRIQAMVDFLFGKPPTIRSLAGDRQTAQAVEAMTARLFEANGGSGFFQELALLGAIYGFVDIVLRPPAEWMAIASRLAARLPAPAQAASRGPESSGAPRPATPSAQDAAMDPAAPRSKTSASAATQLAGLITLETVEASRILPVLDEDDFRSVRCWLQCYRKALPALEGGGPLSIFGIGNSRLEPRTAEVVEIISPRWWQRYEDRRLAAEGPNLLGRLPVVHIQNLPLPGHYEGLGDVEPLLPLQDELNTRLSDRASRVTYQSLN